MNNASRSSDGDACDVVSFYRFVSLPSYRQVRGPLLAAGRERNLLGTVLLAPEGINATLAGERDALASLLDWLGDIEGLADVEGRWSRADEPPFRRLRVRLRREIVSLGRPDVDASVLTGERVSPAEWNGLIADPETLVIDTRNRYEIDVGRFPGAVDPGTDSFRDFPGFVDERLAGERDRPIAMYCTGGIRCEKATAMMREMGFERVYQLEGGILGYLDAMAESPDNRWEGECFVFDSRVAVDRRLAPGHYVQCHACRRPLSAADVASPLYAAGVSCPHCHGDVDSDRAERLAERRRQVELAEARGERHIGAVYGGTEEE
ncbi:oxygen-dependent tRNA uridine(34) hydroxylase TrhO [Lentisalinibacter sediminis]|uniref:oxygen-dependent tRNA uridine(34) hydroxylase TrhO n=1 Tax=Lentisalinibacter sediminis TaxID=2992237 RepID=UPI00386A62AD